MRECSIGKLKLITGHIHGRRETPTELQTRTESQQLMVKLHTSCMRFDVTYKEQGRLNQAASSSLMARIESLKPMVRTAAPSPLHPHLRHNPTAVRKPKSVSCVADAPYSPMTFRQADNNNNIQQTLECMQTAEYACGIELSSTCGVFSLSIEVENSNRRLSKLEMLKRRGKGPPKKGHGKRASKKNK
nr:28S ribosomal protein S33, mitochondrial [Tanacetum cinerariifolium]